MICSFECTVYIYAMTGSKRKPRVKEPVQVYLDEADRELLERTARASGLARAEVLRRGLRKLAEELLAEKSPGWSLDSLIGSLDGATDLPPDLASRHDDYLYGHPDSDRDHAD